MRYIFAAGLAGKAKARLAAGGAGGRAASTSHIAGAPPPTHVDPKTGKVVPGAYPTLALAAAHRSPAGGRLAGCPRIGRCGFAKR